MALNTEEHAPNIPFPERHGSVEPAAGGARGCPRSPALLGPVPALQRAQSLPPLPGPLRCFQRASLPREDQCQGVSYPSIILYCLEAKARV